MKYKIGDKVKVTHIVKDPTGYYCWCPAKISTVGHSFTILDIHDTHYMLNTSVFPYKEGKCEFNYHYPEESLFPVEQQLYLL